MANLKIKSSAQTVKKSIATAGRKPTSKSLYSKADLEEIFRRFSIQRPEPKGELEHVNPFTLVVAVALSAQATDVGVNKATRALFAIADTPQKMLDLGEERIREYIKTIGLYRNKAKNVVALSEKLITDFGGEVPRTREELMTLPGVGTRPPMSCCRWRSARRRSPSTRTSSASPTGCCSRPARRRMKSSNGC